MVNHDLRIFILAVLPLLFLSCVENPYLTEREYTEAKFGTNDSAQKAIELVPGVYLDDSLAVGQAKWYRFDAIGSMTYRISWNDSYQGVGKTCDVKVTAYRENLLSYYFLYTDSGFTTPNDITPTISEEVLIKVEGFNIGSSGTFAIRYQ